MWGYVSFLKWYRLINSAKATQYFIIVYYEDSYNFYHRSSFQALYLYDNIIGFKGIILNLRAMQKVQSNLKIPLELVDIICGTYKW